MYYSLIHYVRFSLEVNVKNTFIAIAWRNIWRNKRRSILTISMIAFSLFIAILMEALTYGSHERIFKETIDLHIGCLQIHAKGYQENKTLSYMFTPTEEINNALLSETNITGWTQRIVGEGLISVNENTNGGLIIGIDPVNEAKITTFEAKIIKGEKLKAKNSSYKITPISKFLSDKPSKEAIMGDKLAKNLEAKIGDEVAVMVQSYDGSIGNALYKIIGIYHTGTDYDFGINIHIKEAEEVFSTYGNISEIVVSLPNSRVVDEVVDNLRKKINIKTFEVLSWREISPELVQFMELDSASSYLFVLILLMVMGFSVLNTVFITIMERIRELGILKALGTTPLQIFGIVMGETVFLALIGIVIGNIVGGLGGYYFQLNPIDISSFSDLYEDLGINPITSIPAELGLYNFVNFSSIVFLLSIIAAIYPGIKAARLNPVQALKHI